MARFDPTSLTREQLDDAVRTGRLNDYYLDDTTLIKEVATRSGGYVLKLIERVDNGKGHIQMDFIYDRNGRLIDKALHRY